MALLAVLCFVASAYAAAMKRRARLSGALLETVRRRESSVLEAVRVLTAASRESTQAVLAALERTIRVVDPAVDAVLIFVPAGDDLACAYAAGPRTEPYTHLRVRRDDRDSPAARAAICGHRVRLHDGVSPLVPTDRDAIAVPMVAGDTLCAVLYASSIGSPLANPEAVVRSVLQAATPFALAAEREADRANATYDALTGLHAPRAFRQLLHQELAYADAASSPPLSLWFIDTDHFKRVNDSLGHGAGDVVLQKMAVLLRAHTVAGVDVPARNGGDEFCAIVRDGKTAAIERAERFCESVRTFDFGIGMQLTASVGVAAFPYDARTAGELLEAADAAMYHSKRCGRDRVSFAVNGGACAAGC